MQRLPIFQDDQNFRDRTERMFRDMQLQMDHDLLRGFGTGVSRWPLLQDSQGRLGDDYFFQLKPRPLGSSQGGAIGDRGSQEVLDDATVKNLFVEDPEHKSRVFRMSFDVNNYDPKDIQVRVEDRCLVVEARHNDAKEGAKYTKEFCRKIQLPAEVEATKLTSTLSTDGILSVQAPVPPTYQSLSSGGTFATAALPDPGLLLGTGQFPAPLRSSPITIQHTGPVRFNDSSMLTTSSPFQPAPQRVSPITIQQLGSGFGGPTSTTRTITTSGPVTIPVMPYPSSGNVGFDRPVFSTDGGRRRMDLVLDLGRQYQAQDAVVKIDGRRLVVEATREINDHGRISKSSMQREFDLAEDVDPTTVQAMMKVEGQLAIIAYVRQ